MTGQETINRQRQTDALSRLIELMEKLRDPTYGCAWDRKQTLKSLTRHTLEEVYEVIDAVEQDDPTKICDELGDLLFQVIFYARIGEENGQLAHSIDKGLLSRNQGFYNHVSSRLKNNIHLPTSLASFNKTGNVNLKIKLNRQGQVVQILRSSGSNRTLVNYAILSVVAALIEPSMHQFLTSGDSEHIIDLDIHISNPWLFTDGYKVRARAN